MPKKSVRDMKPYELRRSSLSARMFRVIVLLSVIIGLSAVGFGFHLYNDSVRREFMNESCQIARVTSYLIRHQDWLELRDKSISIYEATLPEDEERIDPVYLSNYSSVKDSTYYKLLDSLIDTELSHKARCVYVGAVDTKLNRMIYLLDSDSSPDTHRDTGSFDVITKANKAEYDAYIYGRSPSANDIVFGREESYNAYITNDTEYGYNCTGASYIDEDERYIYLAFADMDMREVVKANRLFLTQFMLLLLVVTFIVAALINRRVRKNVIVPLNQLTEAANNYSTDRKKKQFGGDHFNKLDIHTGDEIENLSLTMKDMESDLNVYIEELTAATAEKQRINTELDIARDIQNGMLPHTFPPFPDNEEFALYASMAPAKEVGGDFYDFFFLDEKHLALVIADVTGKGVPVYDVIKDTHRNGCNEGWCFAICDT